MPSRTRTRVVVNLGQRDLLAVRFPLRRVAAQVGCSLTLLQKWRDGELTPNAEHAAALEQHFGIARARWAMHPDAMQVSEGSQALALCTMDHETSPPRLWRTTVEEVAATCKVPLHAIARWLDGSAQPSPEAKSILQRTLGIPIAWWGNGPAALEALLPMAWLLGLVTPSAEQRQTIQRVTGIPADDWDRPTAAE